MLTDRVGCHTDGRVLTDGLMDMCLGWINGQMMEDSLTDMVGWSTDGRMHKLFAKNIQST